MNTPGNITHKQLVRSWNKVSKEYIKEGRSIFNVTKEAWDQGYEQATKELAEEINRLKLDNKRAHNVSIEASIKLANAMAQAQESMARSIQLIVMGRA